MPRAKNPPHAHELKRADNLTENAHASKHAHTRAHAHTNTANQIVRGQHQFPPPCARRAAPYNPLMSCRTASALRMGPLAFTVCRRGPAVHGRRAPRQPPREHRRSGRPRRRHAREVPRAAEARGGGRRATRRTPRRAAAALARPAGMTAAGPSARTARSRRRRRGHPRVTRRHVKRQTPPPRLPPPHHHGRRPPPPPFSRCSRAIPPANTNTNTKYTCDAMSPRAIIASTSRIASPAAAPGPPMPSKPPKPPLSHTSSRSSPKSRYRLPGHRLPDRRHCTPRAVVAVAAVARVQAPRGHRLLLPIAAAVQTQPAVCGGAPAARMRSQALQRARAPPDDADCLRTRHPRTRNTAKHRNT
jgi:hypothetical protein